MYYRGFRTDLLQLKHLGDPRRERHPAPPDLLPDRTTGGTLRPRDTVWVDCHGIGRRGTVVEVRFEQIRVEIGGAVRHMPTENVIGVIEREVGPKQDRSHCQWTPEGWCMLAE